MKIRKTEGPVVALVLLLGAGLLFVANGQGATRQEQPCLGLKPENEVSCAYKFLVTPALYLYFLNGTSQRKFEPNFVYKKRVELAKKNFEYRYIDNARSLVATQVQTALTRRGREGITSGNPPSIHYRLGSFQVISRNEFGKPLCVSIGTVENWNILWLKEPDRSLTAQFIETDRHHAITLCRQKGLLLHVWRVKRVEPVYRINLK